MRARNDGLTLRSTTSLIRREVDSLSQKLKEDIGTLKHEWVARHGIFEHERYLTTAVPHSIEMDMNNRKSETRSDQKTFDISIEVRLGNSPGLERPMADLDDYWNVRRKSTTSLQSHLVT